MAARREVEAEELARAAGLRRVEVAGSFWQRLRGWMFRQLPGREGLLLPARSVHTCFVRGRLDLVFLAEDGRVLEVRRGVPPWKVCSNPAARWVLEAPAGCIGDLPERVPVPRRAPLLALATAAALLAAAMQLPPAIQVVDPLSPYPLSLPRGGVVVMRWNLPVEDVAVQDPWVATAKPGPSGPGDVTVAARDREGTTTMWVQVAGVRTTWRVCVCYAPSAQEMVSVKAAWNEATSAGTGPGPAGILLRLRWESPSTLRYELKNGTKEAWSLRRHRTRVLPGAGGEELPFVLDVQGDLTGPGRLVPGAVERGRLLLPVPVRAATVELVLVGPAGREEKIRRTISR